MAYYLKEVSNVGVLIKFLNVNDTFAELIDQFVIRLFQIIGDALGAIDSRTVLENSFAILSVGLIRSSTRASTQGSL